MKAPWHLWVIGIVTLLWNAGGLYDFVMTNWNSETYLAHFTPEQQSYFAAYPNWLILIWGIAVFASVIGSALLLMRSRHAVMVLAIAFVSMLVNMFHGYFIAEASISDVMGPAVKWFSLAIVVVGLALYFYARAMRQRGVLN